MVNKVKIKYEKSVLIGVITQYQTEEKAEEYMEELEFLTFTAGGEVLKRFTQKIASPHPKTFIGTGKIEEVRKYVKQHKVNTVIFDDDLSPAQQRNIERILNCKVRSEEHTSELQSRGHLVCRLLLEKKKQ